MDPTLREPEIMEIVPYGRRPVRVGDVVFFLPPEADQPVVHRVVRVTALGISTRGDNNTIEDSLLVQPENIKGQVMFAWHGRKRRKIAGGLPGRMAGRWLRWRRVLDHRMSPLLHPLYRALSHRGLIARLLPAPFRPRVVVFQAQGQDQIRLLLGRRIIGRYDGNKNQWQIRRPFRLLVDERALPEAQGGDRANRQVLTEQQRAVDPPMPEYSYNLVLADGSRWEIGAGHEEAAPITSQFACAMQLRGANGVIDPSRHGNQCRLLVKIDADAPVRDCYVPLASARNGAVVCTLRPGGYWGSAHVDLVRLSLVIARETQSRGGVLIHGALAERDGRGVIMAGPGGRGKSTASNRLPPPWRSLCDDTTLVARDPQGRYWAHPWPTWSRFMDGGPGGAWNVQSAVPLHGIFFLAQAAEDRVEWVGPGQAVSLLGECVRQASMFMSPGLFKDGIQALHRERFDNLCALARVISAHVLHVSLTGAFWLEMEKALDGGRGA